MRSVTTPKVFLHALPYDQPWGISSTYYMHGSTKNCLTSFRSVQCVILTPLTAETIVNGTRENGLSRIMAPGLNTDESDK